MEINNPEFWRQFGIEPIIINPDDEESAANGLEAITEAILQATEEEESQE